MMAGLPAGAAAKILTHSFAEAKDWLAACLAGLFDDWGRGCRVATLPTHMDASPLRSVCLSVCLCTYLPMSFSTYPRPDHSLSYVCLCLPASVSVGRSVSVVLCERGCGCGCGCGVSWCVGARSSWMRQSSTMDKRKGVSCLSVVAFSPMQQRPSASQPASQPAAQLRARTHSNTEVPVRCLAIVTSIDPSIHPSPVSLCVWLTVY